MPIYEYLCDKCGFRLVDIQKIGSDAPTCSNCGAGMTKQLTCPADYKVGGSARRKWCRDWTPDSKPFKG